MLIATGFAEDAIVKPGFPSAERADAILEETLTAEFVQRWAAYPAERAGLDLHFAFFDFSSL